ncbi:carbohydrate ABC transporter permease [Lysinibacillus endophyticus]|uniref:carbohydrate ABC transporter permease n=1 Tax=Ureibacillus endophyticus TaxID=1978490 RepID=UPI00209F98CD|nr:sugar ABC transporter permease [Lysinibacillus endophyticus]MCP1146776.1 sugar ABC transporter permease [Lysinibacillus endophyticus]
MNNERIKYLLLAPALILISVITIYPLLNSFWISLHDWDLKKSVEMGDFVGIENYTRAFSDKYFWNSVFITLVFVVSTVVITLVLSFLVALLLSGNSKFLQFVRAIIIIPFAISPALVGYSWKFMLNPEYGLFHKIAGTLFPFLQDIVWLGTSFTSLLALISVTVWIWLPFMSLMFISGLIGIPDEVYEAAKVDGATRLQTLYKITLPLMKPIILISSILMTMFTLKVFDPVVTLTQGGPGNSTEVLNFFIYKNAFRYFDMGYSAALGYILAMITIVFVVIYMRKLSKGDDWS